MTFKTEAGLVKAFTEDMRIGGMFIRTPKPLPTGETFMLKLTLPKAPEPLNIGCTVAWNRPASGSGDSNVPGMGVKFTEISDEIQTKLKEELAKDIK